MSDVTDIVPRAPRRRRREASGSPEDFLTTGEVAQILRCDRKTVRRFIADGNLEAHRIGRYLRVRRRVLEAWIDSQRIVADNRVIAEFRNPEGWK